MDVVNDGLPEEEEIAIITLRGLIDGIVTIGTQNTAFITITNLGPRVEIQNASVYLEGGYAEFHVWRQGDTNTAFTVDYATTTNGTAVAGVDFTPQAGTLTFIAGSRGGRPDSRIIISVLDDGVPNFGPPKWFSVQLTGGTGSVQLDTNEFKVQIEDRQFPATLDLSFAPKVSVQVPAAAQRADGELLVANVERLDLEPAPNTWFVRLALLNSDGSIEGDLPVTFIPSPSQIGSLRFWPDGKILIVGDFEQINAVPRPGVARLNRDGSLDLDFAPVLTPGQTRAAFPLGDDRLLVWTSEPEPLVVLDARGRPDPNFRLASFPKPERLTFHLVTSVVPTLDDRVLIATSSTAEDLGVRRSQPFSPE